MLLVGFKYAAVGGGGCCEAAVVDVMVLVRCLLLVVLLSGSISVPCRSVSYAELSALGVFRKAIDDDSSSILADWSHNSNGPCSWKGVFCSEAQDHVLALNLSHLSLKGAISAEVGSLTFLKQLDLSQNLLRGVIPKQIGMLENLQVLDLSGNRLSGSIPPDMKGLTRITKINLRSNGLTGVVPPEFGDLPNLVELRLDRNRLHGPIPGNNSLQKNASALCLLKKLKIGDFSYNFFTGRIPRCLAYLPRSSFQGNCLHDKNTTLQRSIRLCGHFGRAKGSDMSSRHSKPESNRQKPQQLDWILISVTVAGALFVVTLVAVVVTAFKKYEPISFVQIPWKRDINQRKQIIMSFGVEIPKQVLSLSRQELEVVCEDFSNIIGLNSETIVYKGTLHDGNEVAVITLCVSEDNWNSNLELYFQSEVANLARLNHENTASMLGYCKEDKPFTRMLIIKYASNGTLYEHLHYGERCQLYWSRRMKIAIGVARGLKYLHMDLQPPFSFFELCSSSVYLTEDFHPKLIDFERWKVLTGSEKSNLTSKEGAYCGLHDSLRKCHMGIQRNVFDFGILLLEIVSGRLSYCKDRGYLLDWAMEYLGRPEMLCHLIDPELRYFNHDDLHVICSVVSLCVHPESFRRPSMDVLLGMLEDGIDTSTSANLKESSLSWAELALTSS